MTRIGFVTGLPAEARLLVRAGRRGQRTPLVACTFADPAAARGAVERLLANGASLLVSFGLAGALDQTLRPGDIVVARAAVLPSGDRIDTDVDLTRALARWLTAQAIPFHEGLIAGSDVPLATRAAKRDLRARRAAAAVDMESHVVAELAAAAEVPFVVLRAVADGPDRAIPTAALLAAQHRHVVRQVATVAARLVLHPEEIRPLAILAGEARAGMAALGRVVGADPDLFTVL